MAMLELVGDKFTHDAPKLCEDENLLSHAVDEMLLFHQELSTAHGFPVGQLNCLHVLTEEICFRKWLEIERQSNNAVQPCYSLVCSWWQRDGGG